MTYKKLIILFLFISFQTVFSQNDCINAIVSCGNTTFNNLAVQGSGIQEITGGNSCGSQENNSLWIKVTIKTAGTLGFLITPESSAISVDFDFFVFGPDVTCGNLGTAIRCSTTNPVASGATDNLTGMREFESDWTEGPFELGNNYVHWLDVVENETYFIVVDRAVGNGNFSLEWTGTATFSDPPIMNNSATGALNIELCDNDTLNDGLTEFDLTPTGNLAIGSQTDIIASYFLTENDATVNTNAIANPINFRNSVNPQTLFLRLQNSLSGCYTIEPFTLSVTPFNLPDIDDLQQCDNNNDGFATFNLLVIRNLLTADPNNIVSFHPTNNGTVNLPDNYTNQTAFTNEVIWAKIENTVRGCLVYKSFNIIINPTPIAIASQITQCDFEIFPDGITTFNLAQANNELTNGDNSLLTKFYLNATDAQNNANELNTIFNNTINPQILTVKVINPATACFTLTQLTLNVSVNPTTTVTLENCDDSIEDGSTTFNLADAGFESGLNTVNYYYTANDALMEQNPIATNQFSTQDIYARIENGNNCTGIHIIQLKVVELPQATIDIEGILCANLPNHSAILQTIVDNPANYSYLWSPNGETTQNITVFNPGVYDVVVTDVVSNCSKTVSVNLGTSQIATLQNVEVNDLVQVNSVTVVASGTGDYWYSLDDGIYQQSNFFDNVVPGHHTVTVEDRNGCGIVSLNVFVLGVPYYFTPNGDGYQDYWQIKGIDLAINGNSIIYIFNRFGKLMKQISTTGQGWDGNFNGHPMPGDDYWYNIEFGDGRNVKGHFTLKR